MREWNYEIHVAMCTTNKRDYLAFKGKGSGKGVDRQAKGARGGQAHERSGRGKERR